MCDTSTPAGTTVSHGDGQSLTGCGLGKRLSFHFPTGPFQHIRESVLLSYQSCGHCRQCQSGHLTDCERFYETNFGFARLNGSNAMQRSGVRGHFFGQSSFATHTLATKRNLVKVSKNLPLEVLAPLGCGLQTGAGTGMNSLGASKGASIAIFGVPRFSVSNVLGENR